MTKDKTDFPKKIRSKNKSDSFQNELGLFPGR